MWAAQYSATNELSVCKACYRRLIKFKKASDYLEELKIELIKSKSTRIVNFRERSAYFTLRTTMENSQPRAVHVGNSRNVTLFPIATTSTSFYASANFTATSQPIGVSPIRSHPCGLVLQIFPGQLKATPSPLLMFTRVLKLLTGLHDS